MRLDCACCCRPQADYYAATVAVDVLSFLYVAVNYQVRPVFNLLASTNERSLLSMLFVVHSDTPGLN